MSGIFTPGFPNIAALVGTEQIPLDTGNAQGLAPESAYATSAQLATFATGGTPGANAIAALAGAATLNAQKGKVTSEALTTAAGSDYVLTLTDSVITTASIILVSVANGTNTTEGLDVQRCQPSAGSAIIHIRNTHASAALNGTIVIGFLAV